ncbi:MAG: M48 family metalloprotease [Oscillospiraceae bacterium]|nr:M48 family metalloprotease [Oscillospiraceae bacterium]
MWFTKYIGSNYLYIIWFVIYFLIAWYMFGANLNSLIFVSIIYSISITVALSPIGEVILRAVENCREPLTEREKSYLLPIFEEVYDSAKEINPSLNSNIKIYIMDAMFVNAFAIGRQTIAVTKGAIETFSEDELKGILAHELGHMTYGHTKALLLSVIGNFFFTVIVWIFRLMLYVTQLISTIVAQFNIIGLGFMFVTFIAKLLVEISVLIFINISQVILALNSRMNEEIADKFAHEMGYGRELISGLYLLQKITMNTKIRLVDRVKASHPHLGNRIAKLERLEDEATG